MIFLSTPKRPVLELVTFFAICVCALGKGAFCGVSRHRRNVADLGSTEKIIHRRGMETSINFPFQKASTDVRRVEKNRYDCLNHRKPCSTWVYALSKEGDDTNVSDMQEVDTGDTEMIRGSEDDVISDQVWEDIETGAPSEWMIMKELLGISVFTYILGGVTLLFLGLNLILGPGWLGQIIGIEGTGTFTQVSDSLPDTVDLNSPDYLL